MSDDYTDSTEQTINEYNEAVVTIGDVMREASDKDRQAYVDQMKKGDDRQNAAFVRDSIYQAELREQWVEDKEYRDNVLEHIRRNTAAFDRIADALDAMGAK
jgi:hypothetical protein